MSNGNDPAGMPSPRTTPEPEAGSLPEKPIIVTFNASNPDFIPGYSVLRVEQARHLRPEEKTRLMNTIVDDLVASISLINEYHRNGLLSDENISQVSTMIQSIGDTNVRVEGRCDEKIERLRRERRQVQQDYRELAQEMDTMGQKYADKVQGLEDQVAALKKQIALLEAGGTLRRPQSRMSDHDDRHFVKEELEEEEQVKVETCDDMKQTGEEDVDGEWEDEDI